MKHLHKRYFSFHGKTSRKQYWSRTLAFLIGSTLLIVLFKKISLDSWKVQLGIIWFGTWLWLLFATSIRRCYDVGINQHWLWLWLCPGVGNVFYIVLGCLKPDDGVRITRPTPKKGLVRYLSIFGYATRQEYWCIAIPISMAIYAVSFTAVLLFAYLANFFVAEPENGVDILLIFFEITAIAVYSIVPAWLTTAACVRRCRDAALNPWWSMVCLLPLWLYPIVFSPFLARTPQSLLWKLENPIQLFMLNGEIDNKFIILYLLMIVFYIVYLVVVSFPSKEKT